MLRIMVGDDPFLDFCMFDEGCGIGDRGVSPADFCLIFDGRILRFMNEEIAVLKELDLAVVGYEQRAFLAEDVGITVISHQEFIIGCIAEAGLIDAEFKTDGGTGMIGVVSIDLDIANIEWFAFVDVFEDEVGLDIIEPYGKISIGEHFGEQLAGGFFKADRCPDIDLAVRIVNGCEEGKSGEMVPVGMRD